MIIIDERAAKSKAQEHLSETGPIVEIGGFDGQETFIVESSE